MTKWPKKVKHRNKVLAKVYRPCQGRDSYRVVWRAAGQRQMKRRPTYSGNGGAKEYAEALVKELAAQSQAIMLTPAQATDALAALERLNTFRLAGRTSTTLFPRRSWPVFRPKAATIIAPPYRNSFRHSFCSYAYVLHGENTGQRNRRATRRE